MSPDEEILEIERRLLGAWGSPTTPEVEELIADEFGFWSLTGERWDRARWLRIMAAAPREGDSRVDSASVRVFGDVAVYAARITDVVPEGGETTEVRTCVTDVFARLDGRWRLVASHESVVDGA